MQFRQPGNPVEEIQDFLGMDTNTNVTLERGDDGTGSVVIGRNGRRWITCQVSDPITEKVAKKILGGIFFVPPKDILILYQDKTLEEIKKAQ